MNLQSFGFSLSNFILWFFILRSRLYEPWWFCVGWFSWSVWWCIRFGYGVAKEAWSILYRV